MTPDPIIKICGITRAADALHAVEEGATALGFVFWPRSPRVISREWAKDIIAALPAHVTMVGVFVNESAEGIRRVVEATGIHAVQLHGDETPRDADGIDLPILKSVSLDDAAGQSSVWPEDTTLLLLSGEPLDEPIVGYGPFVMNSREEIAQAIDDYNSGRFGQLGR